jgi:hypothetical protein
MPVPPLGVPKTLSLAFWAGLWGLVYALLERRLTALLGWWAGGLAFGLLPLAVYWFVVLPLKGFGIGAAIIFRSGLALAQRRLRASPGALNG